MNMKITRRQLLHAGICLPFMSLHTVHSRLEADEISKRSLTQKVLPSQVFIDKSPDTVGYLTGYGNGNVKQRVYALRENGTYNFYEISAYELGEHIIPKVGRIEIGDARTEQEARILLQTEIVKRAKSMNSVYREIADKTGEELFR
jgi:hypothetical protein